MKDITSSFYEELKAQPETLSKKRKIKLKNHGSAEVEAHEIHKGYQIL